MNHSRTTRRGCRGQGAGKPPNNAMGVLGLVIATRSAGSLVLSLAEARDRHSSGVPSAGVRVMRYYVAGPA
jgi:hypothetical protein